MITATVLAAANISVFYQAPFDDQNWFSLGETIAFGQRDFDGRRFQEMRVPIRFPKQLIPTPTDFDPHIRWDRFKIQINEWGNIGRLYEATGGWDEFRERWERAQDRIAQGESTEWRIRAQIFRRTDVLYTGKDNVVVPQRGYISLQDIQFITQTFARFEALVEAFTDGAVDVILTYGVEEEPIFGSYKDDELWSFHPFDAAENYLRCRFNYSDYDAVLYFYHPGMTNSYSFGGTIGRANNATLSYVILANGREKGTRIGHTEALIHEWLHQIENTWSRFGYGAIDGAALPNLHAAEQNGYRVDTVGYTGWFAWIRDFMTHNVRQGMWEKMTNRSDPDWDEAFRTTRRSDGSLFAWPQVSRDPWRMLPFVTAEDLAKRIGASSVEIKSGASQLLFLPIGGNIRTPVLSAISDSDFSLNNQLSFDKEAMARIGYADRDLVFVRFDAADFVLSNLGEPDEAKVLGYMGIDGKFVVVADVKLDNDSTAEINVLKLGAQGARSVIKGGGDVFRDIQPAITIISEKADASFAVTDWSGVQIGVGADGTLQLGRETVGVLVLRATASLPDGSRTERPFVIRRNDPIVAKFRAVGTARMSGSQLPIEMQLSNLGAARTANIVATLPTGWEIEGFPDRVQLADYESRTFVGTLKASANAVDGAITLAFDITAADYTGPVKTERLRIVRTTHATLEHATFELTTRPGAGTDGWATPRPDNGGWSVRARDGGFKGQGLHISDSGGTRWGRVNAFGGYTEDGEPDPNWMGYDTADYPYLDFYLKTQYEDNLGLVVTLADGRRFTIMLAGPYKEQWGESTELSRAKFIPNGEWQRIVYDLHSELQKAAGPGRQVVVDIGFGDTRQFSSNQQLDEDVRTHYVDEWRITRDANPSDNTTKEDPDSEIKPGADPKSANAWHRARAAAGLNDSSSPEERAAIRTLLNDPDPIVRINAAAAFARVRDEQSLAALSETARLDPDQRAGRYAVQALELIGTPEAFKELEAVAKMQRFEEYVKAEAALALSRTGNPEYITTIGNLYASNSWMVRAKAARALGNIRTDEAQRRALVFLLEEDPMVRLQVSVIANVDVDPVGRRMEWASVNDDSNVVRAYSFAALARSSDPAMRRLGYAGLADEDPELRRILIQEIGMDGKEHHLPHLAPMLNDSNPDVRAEAVQAMLRIPGQRTWTDFQPLESENYEQVLLPLLRAYEAGKITMPSNMLARLRTHRNAEVRALAGRLQGSR